MASWDESSATQGAVSGAAMGTAIAPGVGTAIGAGIGLLAGGVLGGRAKDAAKKAEERRLNEIKEAIDRQNKDTYEAKVMAERWGLADIGVGEQDAFKEAMFDRSTLQQNYIESGRQLADATAPHVKEVKHKFMGITLAKETAKSSALPNANQIANLEYRMQVAGNEYMANEGIIASYDPNDRSKY